MSTNLVNRAAVAVVAIPTALGVVYVGGWLLAGALAILCVAGTREVYKLAEIDGVQPVSGIGYVGAALAPFCVYAVAEGGLGLDVLPFWLGGAFWLVLVLILAVGYRVPTNRPLAAVSITVFGVFYAACLLSLLILLRHPMVPLTSWAATWMVFLPLVVVWVCDSLAMAGGSIIGGPKMSPVLSPNKTWAGALSGTVGAMVVAPLFGTVLLGANGVPIPLWQLIVYGLLVSAVGQIGDVAESLFKREVNTKDSGVFFGAHGGVLDRLDSLYVGIPTSVILLTLFGVL